MATMANGAELVILSPLEGENHIGSASRQTTASNNLVLTSFSSFKRLAEFEKRVSHAGLYQGIAQNLIRGLNTQQALADFAARVVSVADNAYAFRRLDIVGCVGQLLLWLPLSSQLEGIGNYYKALSLNQGGRGDTDRARFLLEQVAEGSSSEYRARAMLALGTNSVAVGDHETAMSFYRELTRLTTRENAFNPVTYCVTVRMAAVVKAMNGDHRGAISDLESMLPLARMASSVQPYAYYDYVNTLAVELGELGRLDQARRASEIAIASPFAGAYPEWRQTFDEIAFKRQRASHSVVVVRQPIAKPYRVEEPVSESHNLVHLPLAERPTREALADRHQRGTGARVLNFQQWKTAIKASRRAIPEEVTAEQRRRMTTGEKLIRLMDLISQDETDDETIDRILEAVEQIVLNRRNEKLD
jgi:tetratricopeptide (TPR) repeat protein